MGSRPGAGARGPIEPRPRADFVIVAICRRRQAPERLIREMGRRGGQLCVGREPSPADGLLR